MPEYAREYMEERACACAYTYEDVVNIAKQQVQQLQSGIYGGITEGYRSNVVFFDTELIITKVWFLHKFGKCPEFVEKARRASPIVR